MSRVVRFGLLLTLVLALSGAGGCLQTTVDSYRKVPESQVDSAYAKPGVDFSRYGRLQPVPLEIFYYKGQADLDPADLARLRKIFRTAFLAAIGDDYPIADAPGADVLHVSASLVDLELSPMPGPKVGNSRLQGRAAALVANGQLTFFMEPADSVTGEVLARAGHKEKATAAIGVAADDRDWNRAVVAAEHRAGLYQTFPDDNLGR